MKRLIDMGVGLQRFYERIELLIESSRLGPVLWQRLAAIAAAGGTTLGDKRRHMIRLAKGRIWLI
jgi:hypothetical protein